MATHYEIPVFEVLSPTNAARENVLARRWAAQTWNFPNGNITVQPVPVAFALASTDHWGLISLMVAGRQAEIYAPLETLERMVMSLDPSIGADKLDPTARALIVEHALGPVLDAFERTTQMTMELRGVTAPQGLEPHGTFGLRAAHPTFGDSLFLIGCDAITAQRLTPYIEQWPMENARPQGLNVPVSFRVGHSTVDLQALYDLSLGDGIVMDDTSLENHCVVAVIAEKYAARCGITQDGLQLIEPLLSLANKPMENYIMAEESGDHRGGESAPKVSSFGELPITMVFELGRLDVPLSELETIRDGYIFNLNKTKMQAVDIMTGGRVIGSGEIVKVGESFAVRVRNFARP